MQLITTRSLIKSVAKRWDKSYRSQYLERRFKEISQKLHELDLDTCSADNVAAIIGNTSWTVCECSQCEQEVPAIVRLKGWYDSPTDVCLGCLEKAISLIKEEQ